MPASVLVEGTRFKEGLERRLRAQPRLDRLTRRRGQLCSRVYRQLSAVKAELGWAFDLAERLEVTVAETETLTRGRIVGPTLSAGCGRRLRRSCAEWNVHVIHALEQSWLEEAEKRVGFGVGEAVAKNAAGRDRWTQI